jgi:hypothetical protein
MRLGDRFHRHRARGPRAARIGLPAAGLTGTDPTGAPLHTAMDSEWAVLFFLTGSCYGCQAIWEGLAASPLDATGRIVVLVTPSPATESARKIGELAPPGVPVIMSSQAWHDYGVTGAPWCVVVAGGVVVAHDPAPDTWPGVEALLRPGRP